MKLKAANIAAGMPTATQKAVLSDKNKKSNTKRKHSESKEGGAKSKEDNSIFYMYFLHLFFNIGKNRSLQDEHRQLFYIIIQNIHSRNQLENLKQKL